jgi:hypothetical protein
MLISGSVVSKPYEELQEQMVTINDQTSPDAMMKKVMVMSHSGSSLSFYRGMKKFLLGVSVRG